MYCFVLPWEQRKLGEFVDIYDGTHQTPKYTDFGIKFVSVENISNLESKKFIGQEAYTNEYAKKPAEKGDVLMTRIGDIGTSHVVETDEPLAYYVTLALLKPKKIDSYFLSWLISSPKVQQNIWKRTLHIAFPKKINLGEINQVEASIPKEREQQQIGAFFKQLDNTIVQNGRKSDLLKRQKQAYLQKIFSQELRFAGFNDVWEDHKLKDAAQFNPKSILPDKFEYVDLESVVGTEMVSHRTESKDQAPSRAQRLARKGDVFYQTVRPYQMNNYLYDLLYEDYVFSTGYAQMRPNVDSYFLLNSVQNKKFVQHVLDRSTGTSYPAINSSDLSNIAIQVPLETLEQQKIGLFFKQLDNLITLHQQKLELLKKQKQAYLQKMFI
ncbi:restriction endonuclease subunit S [Leuconostoc pseudomesenteroides]|uniref:restriction endonuclease subunit S n=1 Tax=Leuconostoc pseudomesenteroides TaxID=33968 RepID=UPI00301DB3B4